MKKFITAMAIIAALFAAGKAQAQVSLNLGYAPETFKTSTSVTTTTEKYQGFFIGATYNIGIVNNLGVAVGPQLRFNSRNVSSVVGKTTNSQFLLDIPVLINYRFDINRNFSITPFVGPMLSYALSGNTRTTISSTTTKVNWYGDNSDLSRFNLYAALGVSFAFDSFKLFGGYRFGLLDLYKGDYATRKTNEMFVGVGFEF